MVVHGQLQNSLSFHWDTTDPFTTSDLILFSGIRVLICNSYEHVQLFYFIVRCTRHCVARGHEALMTASVFFVEWFKDKCFRYTIKIPRQGYNVLRCDFNSIWKDKLAVF